MDDYDLRRLAAFQKGTIILSTDDLAALGTIDPVASQEYLDQTAALECANGQPPSEPVA